MKSENKIGYVPTFVNSEGLRVMAVDNNNNPSYPTKEACEQWIRSMLDAISQDTIKSIWGDNPMFEATQTTLYPGGDSTRTVFEK